MKPLPGFLTDARGVEPPPPAGGLPRWLVPAIVCVAVALNLFWKFGPVKTPLCDDAYITFRYAKNLVERGELVYNPGHRVLGTTSPLWALILAAPASLAGADSIPRVAFWLNLVFDGLSLVLMVQLGRAILRDNRAVFLAALAYALLYHRVMPSVSGMETPLYVCLILLAFLCRCRGRIVLAGVVAGLAVWTRPDGVLLAGALVAAELPRSPRKAALIAASAAATVLPWILFAWLHYGDVVPNSMHAKSAWLAQMTRLDTAGSYLGLLRDEIREPIRLAAGSGVDSLLQRAGEKLDILTLGRIPHRGLWGSLVLLALPTLLLLWGSLRLVRERPWWGLALFGLGYHAAFLFSGVTSMPWYVLPPLALNLLAVARVAFPREAGARGSRRTALITAAFLLLGAGGLLRSVEHCRRTHDPLAARETIYRDVGATLEQVTTAADRIVVTELGVLGFYSSRFVGDTVGLVWPEAIAHYRAPGILTLSLLETERPECIASIRCFFEDGLTAQPAFTNSYKLVHEYPTTFRGGTDPYREAFAIYMRR